MELDKMKSLTLIMKIAMFLKNVVKILQIPFLIFGITMAIGFDGDYLLLETLYLVGFYVALSLLALNSLAEVLYSVFKSKIDNILVKISIEKNDENS